MKKHLSLVLLVSFCVLNACSDDDANIPTTEPENTGICSEGDFTATCPTATTYTACSEGIVVIRNCPNGGTCENGVCSGSEIIACDPETYVASCKDDSHKSVCGSENKVISEPCPVGTHCAEGECAASPCIEAEFIPECSDSTHYTICQDGFTGYEACEGDAICIEGQCTTELGCEQESYVSECQGTTQRTICSDEGVISSEDCPEGTTCSDGECKEAQPCDSQTYVNTCNGSKRTSCDAGVVAEYDCAGDGLSCYEGECVLASTVECDPATFEDKCIGNTAVTCGSRNINISLDGVSAFYPNMLNAYNCSSDTGYSGICAVIDGAADCYRPCVSDSQSDNASVCDGLYYAISGKCQETSDQRYVFIEDEEAEKMKCDGENVNLCVDGQCILDDKLDAACSVENDKAFCDKGNLYYCYNDGYNSEAYYRIMNCEEDGYVCAEIDSNADCYKPCTVEGSFFYEQYDSPTGEAYKYECTKTSDGLFYVPSKAECYCVIDSKDPKQICLLDNPGDICVNTQSSLEESLCDGNIAKNVMELAVESADGTENKLFEYELDCGDKTCALNENKALCLETCTEEDTENDKRNCDLIFDEGEAYYLSKTYHCEQVNDQYYWIEDEDKEEVCPRGCAEDQSCKHIHDSERTSCSIDDSDKCDNNIFLKCNYGVWNAYDCGNNTCAVTDEFEGCFELCSDDEVDKTTDTCAGNFAEHQVCKAIDGEKYAKLSTGEYCYHGCDEAEGQCIKIHEDEGKTCGTTADPLEIYEKCANDILLNCVLSLDSPGEYVWQAIDCSYDIPSDAPTTEGTCVTDGVIATCAPKCTAADFDVPKTQCVTDTEGYSYVSGWTCVQSGESYYWEMANEACIHGCNEGKTACLQLHDDEGKVCSSVVDDPDYYDIKCDGSIYLACNGSVVEAIDCGSLSCHKDLMCYPACESLGETAYYCKDENVSASGPCVEDAEHGVHVIDPQNDESCTSGCDSATGKCK